MARKIEVEILGDARPLQRSLDHASRSTRQFEQHLSKAGRGAAAATGAFGHLGRSIAFASGAFLGGAGFVSVLKSSIGAASDLHEQINKTNVVFRSSAGTVKEWAKTAATSMGVAEDEALSFASTFGNLLHPMGIARDKAADMSVQLVKLAGDMASFNNASPEDTLRALQAGLAGQVRPLRQFGVFLSDDRVKAEALASGIVKANVSMGKVADAQKTVEIATVKLSDARKKYGASSTQAAQAEVTLHHAEERLHTLLGGSVPALTDAQKAMARYRIIMKDTADAHGDFARTSGGLANQQRILRAELKDTEAKIGTALMPTILNVTKAVTSWLGKTKNQRAIQHAANDAIKVATEVIKGLTPFVKGAAAAAGKFADEVGGWKHAAEIVLSGVLALKLLKVAAAIKAIGTASAVAGGEAGVGGLLTNLLKLKNLGPITVAVVIAAVAKGAVDKESATSVVGHKGPFTVVESGGKLFLRTAGKGQGQRPISKAEAEQILGKKLPAGGGGGAGAGPHTRGAVMAAAAPFAHVPYQWGGGHGKRPGPTVASGHGRTGLGLDCSGYARAVLANMGIQVSGTADGLLHAAKSHPSVVSLMPGDLVFYEGIHPNHVMVYIGNGQVIGETHTGARGPEVKSVTYLSITGTGRYWGGTTGGGGGGKTGGDTPGTSPGPPNVTGSAGAGSSSGGLHTGKAKSKSKTKAAPLLPPSFELAIEQAKRTKGFADDLRAIGRAHDFLEEKLSHTKGAKARLPIVERLNQLEQAADRIKKSQLASKLKKVHDDFKEAWSGVADAAMTAFDRATERGLKNLAKAHEKRLQAIDDELQAETDAIDARAKVQTDALDAALQAELDAVDQRANALTPAEQQLADIEAARDEQNRKDRIDKAQRALAAAAQQEGETEQEFADRKQGLAQDLADALLDEKIAGLRKQAAAERAAIEAQAAADKKAAQDRADAQRAAIAAQAAVEQKAARDRAAANASAENDYYDEQTQRYQDERDQLRKHLERLLVLQLKFWLARNELARKARDDLVAFIRAHPELGISENDLAAILGADTTLPPGTSNPGSGRVFPAMAAGGIVRRPTVALIGEAGAEAVIPLDRYGGDVVIPITLELDGQVLARTTHKELLRYGQRNGRVGLS